MGWFGGGVCSLAMLSTDQVVVCLLPLAKLLLRLLLFLACFQRRCCCAFKVSVASKSDSVHSRCLCLSHSCVCFRVCSPDIPPLLFIVSFVTVNRNRGFFNFVHPCCSSSVFASFWFGLAFFFFSVGFWSSAYTFVCSPLRDLVFCAALY